jgi:hypothetical protein
MPQNGQDIGSSSSMATVTLLWVLSFAQSWSRLREAFASFKGGSATAAGLPRVAESFVLSVFSDKTLLFVLEVDD